MVGVAVVPVVVLARGDARGRVRNFKEETFPGSCAAGQACRGKGCGKRMPGPGRPPCPCEARHNCKRLH